MRSMFASILLATLVLGPAAPSVRADLTPTSQWVQSWSPKDATSAQVSRFAVAADGSIYLAMIVGDATIDQNIEVLKYDSGGMLLWHRIYDGPGGGADIASDIAATPEGVSIVGASMGLKGPQTVLLNYDAAGTLLNEQRTIGQALLGFLQPQVAVGPDGRRVIGTRDDDGNALIAAFTARGTPIFEQGLAPGIVAGVSAIAVDAANAAWIVSVEEAAQDSAEYVVRRFDADGNELWSHHERDNTGLVLSEAEIVIAANGDGIFIGTPEVNCPTGKSRVVRLSPDGTVRWRHEFPESGCEFTLASDVALGLEDEVYVATVSASTSTLVRIDADGSIPWTVDFGGDGVATHLTSVIVTSAARIAVVGVESPGSMPVFPIHTRIACLDPAGNVGFTMTDESPNGNTIALTLIESAPDGSVTIAGTVIEAESFELSVRTLHLAFAECTGDLDENGAVDAGDLGILLGLWSNRGSVADLDGSGVVDAADLAILLGAWGTCEVAP